MCNIGGGWTIVRVLRFNLSKIIKFDFLEKKSGTLLPDGKLLKMKFREKILEIFFSFSGKISSAIFVQTIVSIFEGKYKLQEKNSVEKKRRIFSQEN